MGTLDFFFGKAPGIETETLDTLTPEQQEALNQLLIDLGIPREGFGGETNVNASNLSQLSLDALEQRALALGNPDREGDVHSRASDTLIKLLDFESQDAGVEDFFRTNIRDPALKEFQETVLPAISRDFGGANFFGSERRATDREAQEELINSLTRSRSELGFRSRESDRNRALQALGISGRVAGGRTNELLSLLAGGESQTALGERNAAREFDKFLSETDIDQTRIDQLLAGINTEAIENVAIASGGTEGIIGGILSLIGGVAGGPGGAAVGSGIGDIFSKGGPNAGQGARIGI